MLELIEKSLKCGKILPLEQVRSVFECRTAIPDDMPEIQTILTVSGTIKAVNLQDGGQTPGLTLEHTILYVSTGENSCVMSFSFTTEHSLGLNYPEDTQDAQLMLTAFIEHIDFTVDSSRSITLRSVVRAEPRLFCNQEKQIVTDLSGLEDLQVKQGYMPISDLQLLPEIITEIKDELVLPAGKKSMERILQNEAHISDVTVAIEDGLAIIKGTISTCTLYISEDGGQTPELWENRIPFTCNLILPSTDAQLIFKNCKLNDFTAEIKEDGDGEPRLLAINILISATAVCCESKEISVVADAFSLSKNLNFTTAPVKISRLISGISGQFVLKDIAQKPEESPAIAEIINITGAVGHTEVQVHEGKISIDGFISCKVLYLTQDAAQPIAAFDIEIPFTQSMEEPHAEAGLFAAVEAEVVHISFCIISPEEIELRLALHVSGTLTKTEEFSTITSVTEGPLSDKAAENRPSILIYIVQPGDTLWEIAKHYGSSPDALQNLNNIKTPENLMPGQKLIIA